MVPAESEWSGRQRIPLPSRITGELPALDKLLQRSGWRRLRFQGGRSITPA